MTEEERMRQASAAKIARSQAQATPIRPQAPLQPQQAGGQGGGFGQMIGKKLLGAALGSVAGPLGPLLGGLFNDGGEIRGYAKGGEVEDESRSERKKRREAAAARGEHEVADWFFNANVSDARSPIGEGYEWRDEPNREGLRNLQKQELLSLRAGMNESDVNNANFEQDKAEVFKKAQYLVTPQALIEDSSFSNDPNRLRGDKPYWVDWQQLDNSGGDSGRAFGGASQKHAARLNSPEMFDWLSKQPGAGAAAVGLQIGRNEGGSVGGGKTISPTTRQLFDAKGNNIGQVPGDVIPGYNRESSGVGNQVDPFEGVAAKISADKAEGKPVDYAALAAIQHIRSIQNQAEKDKAMREFMQKYPEFAVPGGSQGVVLRNTGGPLSP